MGSTTMVELPHIDLFRDPSVLEPGTLQWNSSCRSIREAMETHGCFILVGNSTISPEMRQGMLASMGTLFNLPVNTKRKNAAINPIYYTYVEPNPRVPYYEALAVINAAGEDGAQSFTELMWPEGHDSFCKTLNSMSKEKLKLAEVIMRMILESFGAGSNWESCIGNSDNLLRMIRYSALTTEDKAVGLHGHTDPNYLTLLSQNGVDGLQIKLRGGEWIDVKLEEGSIVVVGGQALAALTNGRLCAPLHSVMIGGERERFSYGLFLVPKGSYTLEPLTEFVDDEHPSLFRPFNYMDFLISIYLKENDENSLKMYAGV